ncbi:winged helix-turn-helix transcriptional regulator [Clostridium paraputrificum]|uniref:winged helix-turn-helix transcriptional regulator n=1 Tax=Clostridium TaxID=1485 RepID=UPI003D33130F
MKTEDCILNEMGYEKFESFLRMIDGKWKLRIVFLLALHQVLRYGELKKLLHPITHKMLAAQLKELEQDALVIRTEYPQIPPKVEYSLSEMGRDLRPVVEKICDWINIYNI